MGFIGHGDEGPDLAAAAAQMLLCYNAPALLGLELYPSAAQLTVSACLSPVLAPLPCASISHCLSPAPAPPRKQGMLLQISANWRALHPVVRSRALWVCAVHLRFKSALDSAWNSILDAGGLARRFETSFCKNFCVVWKY